MFKNIRRAVAAAIAPKSSALEVMLTVAAVAAPALLTAVAGKMAANEKEREMNSRFDEKLNELSSENLELKSELQYASRELTVRTPFGDVKRVIGCNPEKVVSDHLSLLEAEERAEILRQQKTAVQGVDAGGPGGEVVSKEGAERQRE